MFQTDFQRDQLDDFAEPWHLEVFHFPDLEHLGAELLAYEGHLPFADVNGIKAKFCQDLPHRVVGKRKGINKVEQIRQISPQNLFFKRAEAERIRAALLDQPGAITGLQPMKPKFFTKPPQSFWR